jgi:SAM-dependent methyltransferase
MLGRGNYLEGALDPEAERLIREAVTAGWDQDFVNSEAGAPAVEDVVFRRHDNTVRFVVPWIDSVRPLKESRVLDFGSGCGSSALAFARFSPEVVGFEIDPPSVDAFRERMRVAQCPNASVSQHTPDEIMDAALAEVTPGTTVLFLAVIEHLTEDERLDYLTSFWKALSPGDLLVVAETPNYYAYFDGHTFGVPFAHMIPDQYFERWLETQDEDLRFRKDLLDLFRNGSPEEALERRRRLGIGVSHHVFELAFETDLRELVVADGFSPEIVDWFPLSTDDRSLVNSFRDYEIDLPIGFARSVLSFVFRKPRSTSEAQSHAEWNRKHREEVIRRLTK